MRRNRFITGYSGFRALAVIGVILYHLDSNSFMGGYLGVPIFFVLSGYLVTDHILNSYDRTGDYDNKHFYLIFIMCHLFFYFSAADFGFMVQCGVYFSVSTQSFS